MITFLLGALLGFTVAVLMVRCQFKTGYWLKAGKWSGWACQYPGKMPRFYGAKEIAMVNLDAGNGDRLFKVVEVGDE